jgi:hypothetical protein
MGNWAHCHGVILRNMGRMRMPITLMLAGVVAGGALGLAACGEETTTAPPTGTPTAPVPPPQADELEHVPPPEDTDPAGRAVPDPGHGRPVVEQEGPGAPGTREGPTVR